jgi:hypothetical protein
VLLVKYSLRLIVKLLSEMYLAVMNILHINLERRSELKVAHNVECRL